MDIIIYKVSVQWKPGERYNIEANTAQGNLKAHAETKTDAEHRIANHLRSGRNNIIFTHIGLWENGKRNKSQKYKITICWVPPEYACQTKSFLAYTTNGDFKSSACSEEDMQTQVAAYLSNKEERIINVDDIEFEITH